MLEFKFPRSTKIVATIGTATNDPVIIKKLIKTGVNVFRLNFSHGNHGDHLKRITYIRSAEKEMNSNVAILADLQGPKFRIGSVKNDQLIHQYWAEHPEFWTSNLGLLGVVSPSNYREVNPQSFSPLAFFLPKYFFLNSS